MLKETIKTDLKSAMKSGDKNKTQVLRMLLSEISYGETATQPFPAEKAVQKYAKKLQDAVYVFTETADQMRLADAKQELEIVGVYLPKQASQEEIEAFLATVDFSKPFGELMKATKAAIPSADGKLVSDLIKARQKQ